MSKVNIEDKYKLLIESLKNIEPFIIAFSGGVDSTFLTAAAKKEDIDFETVTVKTPFVTERETKEIKKIVKQLDLKHKELKIQLDELGEAVKNTADRCYYCKKIIFNHILNYADGKTVIEGSNYDDINDYRPGRRALKELKIKSPLLQNKLTKNEIRSLSKKIKISTWNKPSHSCLATRISYNNSITKERLKKIELAEELLYKNGFNQFRVRDHNGLARIELSKNDREKILDSKLMDKLSDKFKKLGFYYVTLDLSVYKSGSMNKVLFENNK